MGPGLMGRYSIRATPYLCGMTITNFSDFVAARARRRRREQIVGQINRVVEPYAIFALNLAIGAFFGLLPFWAPSLFR